MDQNDDYTVNHKKVFLHHIKTHTMIHPDHGRTELDEDRLFFETGPRSGQRTQKYRRVPKPVIILKISDQLFPGYLTKTLSFGPKL